MSFNRILVALDQSPQQTAVFEQALDLAHKRRSPLLLLHCVEVLPALASPMGGVAPVSAPYPTVGMTPDPILMGHAPGEANYWQQEMQTHRTWLNEYCQRAIASDIPAEYECVMGKPADLICEWAQRWQADLIVIGRQGHSGITELLLGSVSNYVMHHAPCSVLVIQNHGSANVHASVSHPA